MTILLGIITAHFLVMFRAKQSFKENVPYASVFFITVVMVIFVVIMMYTMPPPVL